jgi:hypothetical protein
MFSRLIVLARQIEGKTHHIEGQFHFSFILCPEGYSKYISVQYVGGVKISCGLLPTCFSSYFVLNSVNYS